MTNYVNFESNKINLIIVEKYLNIQCIIKFNNANNLLLHLLILISYWKIKHIVSYLWFNWYNQQHNININYSL